MAVREKLIELLDQFVYDEWYGNDDIADKLIANGVTVQSERMVDAVPVVRCKDCKWLYDEMDDYFCRSHRGLVRICENSFCSYGERKDGKRKEDK